MFEGQGPIYLQIAGKIKDDILKGELEGDEQVMSTNQFAAFYRINPATAAKAFQELVEEGILYKRRGIGMFVKPDARRILLEKRRDRFFKDVLEPMIEEATVIGISLDDVIRRLEDVKAEGSR